MAAILWFLISITHKKDRNWIHFTSAAVELKIKRGTAGSVSCLMWAFLVLFDSLELVWDMQGPTLEVIPMLKVWIASGLPGHSENFPEGCFILRLLALVVQTVFDLFVILIVLQFHSSETQADTRLRDVFSRSCSSSSCHVFPCTLNSFLLFCFMKFLHNWDSWNHSDT